MFIPQSNDVNPRTFYSNICLDIENQIPRSSKKSLTFGSNAPSMADRFPDMPCMKKVSTPGHALHEKSFQRQKGVGLLVGIYVRRALLVPRLNRVQTACQPVILFSHSVYIGFRLFVLQGSRSGDVSSMPWKLRGMLVSWANSSVGIQSCPTPPHRPAVRPDPTRPWYVRILDSTSRDLNHSP